MRFTKAPTRWAMAPCETKTLYRRTATDIVKISLVSALGNILEWYCVPAILWSSSPNVLRRYDFALFQQFAVEIGDAVFPCTESTITRYIKAFLLFAVGMGFRPIGGILFGHLGDRWGRRNTFMLTALMMSFGALGMAVLPGREIVGGAAPYLLVFVRIIQSISVGGELIASCVITTEESPRWKRGLVTGVGPVFGSFAGAI